MRYNLLTRAKAAGAALSLLLLIGTGAARGQERPEAEVEIGKLIDRIARGNATEAADATEDLVARVVEPVAAALAAAEARPIEERVRIQEALSRLSAVLRLRILRAQLGEEDRALFDAFAAQFPELVERLFDEDFRRRVAAVKQIPLEPGTGAGVLIVAKLNDPDEDVVVAALEAAKTLHDPVVLRGLQRYVREATEVLKSGYYGAAEQEIAVTVALFVSRAIRVLCDNRAMDAVPDILAAVEYLGSENYGVVFDLPGIAAGLGKLGDERAAPVLIRFLNGQRVCEARSAGPGRLIRQTVGDAVLLGLLEIHHLEPATFGFVASPAPNEIQGFVDERSRELGHQRFLQWYEQNAGKPPAAREVPTSQPTKE